MTKNFIKFYAPGQQNEGGGAATPATAIAPPSIADLLAKNIEASKASKAETIEVMVTSITGWRAALDKNGQPLETVMVVTDKGNFWPLKSSVKNMPKSFFQPVKARATVLPRTTANGDIRLNMSSLEFEGLATEKALAIQEMKPGTALFASM